MSSMCTEAVEVELLVLGTWSISEVTTRMQFSVQGASKNMIMTVLVPYRTVYHILSYRDPRSSVDCFLQLGSETVTVAVVMIE